MALSLVMVVRVTKTAPEHVQMIGEPMVAPTTMFDEIMSVGNVPLCGTEDDLGCLFKDAFVSCVHSNGEGATIAFSDGRHEQVDFAVDGRNVVDGALICGEVLR